MRLVHSECGGELKIDRGEKVRIMNWPDNRTDIFYPIKCEGCNEHLGLLPNVAEEDSLVH